MSYLFETIMTAVLAFVFGCFIWAIAHLTVAHECKRKQEQPRDN